MSKKIKRIIVTRTIIYDRDEFEKLPGIKDDQQFTNWVEETIDDDFKYPSNFTQDFSIHKNNERSFGYLTR